jgi:hypothetical protein
MDTGRVSNTIHIQLIVYKISHRYTSLIEKVKEKGKMKEIKIYGPQEYQTTVYQPSHPYVAGILVVAATLPLQLSPL